MPGYFGAWINTEKGTCCCLITEKTSKGLGTSSLLKNTSSLFHWEYISMSLTLPSDRDRDLKDMEPSKDIQLSFSSDDEGIGHDTGTAPVFDWKPPDLSAGGEWFLERVASLRKAAANLPDPENFSGLEPPSKA
jgi:hypothetical protein